MRKTISQKCPLSPLCRRVRDEWKLMVNHSLTLPKDGPYVLVMTTTIHLLLCVLNLVCAINRTKEPAEEEQ